MSNTTTDTSASGAEDQDLGAAGSQLSTAPQEEAVSLPSLGVVGWVRWFWRQLTSMRVALLLLLLLSLGAIPGSLIPQTGIDVTKVVRTGLLPVVNTGIAGRVAGTGQVGAGLAAPPAEVFTQALRALAEEATIGP